MMREYLDENLGNLSKIGILVSYGTEFRVVDLEEAVSASVFRQKSKWGVESSILHSSMKVVRNKKKSLLVIYRTMSLI